MSTESDATIAPPPRSGKVSASSLIDVLRWRAEHEADRLAYRLASDEDSRVPLTYGDLDLRARAIAVLLKRAASRGDRAVLLFQPGLDFVSAFFGCLYAGVVAVPVLPPRPNRGLPRLERILEDSGAAVVLTGEGVLSGSTPTWSPGPILASLRRLSLDEADHRLAGRWEPPPVDSDDLAFLQYTSGSTSEPRGVMVSHGNLLYNCDYMREVFGLSRSTVSASWLPHFHDMGLVEGLINPMYTGYPAVLIPPAQFVGRPIRWLQVITKFRVTHSGAPNFAYDLCVRKVRPEERAHLDLSSWTLAYSGAEPVRRATMDRFAEYFASCGFEAQSFFPAYGLAEATLMVCGGRRTESPSAPKAPVSCGRARRETRIAIVDPVTRRLRSDLAEGEIWLSGPTVARGYWNRRRETSETFEAYTADTDEGPFLRTGDLGVLDGGDLSITGRLKDLIIIRGSNFYPQDIEWVVGEAHEALRPGFGAAFSVAIDDEERLVVANEVERRYRGAEAPELESIARAVRQAVADEFELPVHAVRLLKVGSIPMTSSGKIQRHVCRADFLSRSEVLWESRLDGFEPAPGNGDGVNRKRLAAMSPRLRRIALEEHLCRQIARGLRIGWRQIDPRRGLGSYGLESLKGRELIAQLEDDLGLKLPGSTLFNYPSVSELSAELLRLMRIDAAEIPARHQDEGRSAP
jgi:acyl-CoA synthetase (AMP-forming)/AMP-acid ligase II